MQESLFHFSEVKEGLINLKAFRLEFTALKSEEVIVLVIELELEFINLKWEEEAQ